MPQITTFLTYNTGALEAAELYVSVFPRSRVVDVQRHGDAVMSVTFELDGQRYMALNGGPSFQFATGMSLFVSCETQAEVDAYCTGLTAQGGEQGRCGWLKDRFGVSWQIIPTALGRLLGDPDRARAGRALQAMLQMGKLDIAALERAADGTGG